jgi:hypothetical protein
MVVKMALKPITPEEANALKRKHELPDFVMEAWNEMITDNLQGAKSVFSQRALVHRIVAKAEASGVTVPTVVVYESGWLDLEETFRRAGWTVRFDKPGHNESYEPTYTFGLVLKRGG